MSQKVQTVICAPDSLTATDVDGSVFGAGRGTMGRQGTGARVFESLRESDPRTIGGFRLTQRLGQGGMGAVYLGYRTTRPVAVKVIKPALADDPYFRQRFRQEVEAIRRVGGFHTAALVDADTESERPWIATEYIHAPSLEDLVQQHGPVTELGTWWLAAGLADALMRVHSVRLLHRDLKPSNVLVAADGARVIDFGISHVGGATGLTTGHATLGTLAYMAPEQARDARRASEAADVYSLGATLVYAATGHQPFHADIAPQRVLDVEPDLDGLPDGLRPLVVRALTYAPADRPTARSVLEDAMDQLAGSGVPVSGQPYPPLPDAFIGDVLQIAAAPPVPFAAPAVQAATPLAEAPQPPPAAVPLPPARPESGQQPQDGPAPWSDHWRERIRERRTDFGG
ncbi:MULTISPECIES: serine/threonine-protein kinase [Kitasatospora]|uniref:Serine/threonine-protein kinase n=1 Tax=Kitasatospora cathayae TaxID=3004092 RepID=A0ABY7QB83_9ACTN|nr:serine/threonine-protein kinase [Kitasatospora sp. HUAS 3-15]WBP89957.1 serine/threonine-protein kinase [Kitasatospora sp. HUAS 3-15]